MNDEPPRPAALFDRLAREAETSIRCRLFTITAFDAGAMSVERIYSTDPSVYPVGGRKPKRDTEFGRRVLVEGRPLVCEGDDAIARVFDDHATIRSLGLHASINAPVVAAGGRVVGVLNALTTSERVDTAQLDAACRLARDPELVAALRALAERDAADAGRAEGTAKNAASVRPVNPASD